MTATADAIVATAAVMALAARTEAMRARARGDNHAYASAMAEWRQRDGQLLATIYDLADQQAAAGDTAIAIEPRHDQKRCRISVGEMDERV